MIESFRSPLLMETKRIEIKLARKAEAKPLETMTLLLRNYDHENDRVRQGVRRVIRELAKGRSNMDAVLTDMVHPSRNVRKAVQSFLGDFVGAHAVTYASFYEQTMLLVAMSKRKDIPVDDIMSLAELTKQTFIDGEVMEAVKDIGFCLDFVKHRYKSSEQLKEYVADILKMAPDLTRMGVYNSAIEEPLRKAMKASRTRNFNETRDLIEERTKESRLRNDLHRIAREVRESINKRPYLKREELAEPDVRLLVEQHKLMDSVTSLVLASRRSEAIDIMLDSQDRFLNEYEARLKGSVAQGDASAIYAFYNTGLVLVKVASSLIPASAEDIYQSEFRHLEGEPSIHIVMWPEPVMGYVQEVVGQLSDKTSANS